MEQEKRPMGSQVSRTTNPPADLSRHGLDTEPSQYLQPSPNTAEENMNMAMENINQGKWVFRALTEVEVKEFRRSARLNYKPFSPIEGIWHPIYQLECVRMNHENSKYKVAEPDRREDEG